MSDTKVTCDLCCSGYKPVGLSQKGKRACPLCMDDMQRGWRGPPYCAICCDCDDKVDGLTKYMRLDRANPAQYHEACWTRMQERHEFERLMQRVRDKEEQVEYDENGLPMRNGNDELEQLLEKQELAAEQLHNGLIDQATFDKARCGPRDVIRTKTLPAYWNTCVPDDS